MFRYSFLLLAFKVTFVLMESHDLERMTSFNINLVDVAPPLFENDSVSRHKGLLLAKVNVFVIVSNS